MPWRIVIWAIGTVVAVLIFTPVVDWPVALGVVKAVALCGITALTLCRRH